MACTSLATVAENAIVYFVEIELVQESDVRCYSAVQQRALVISLLDHIQHLHQRVWAVARSLSGQSDEMTPRQERKSLTSIHIGVAGLLQECCAPKRTPAQHRRAMRTLGPSRVCECLGPGKAEVRNPPMKTPRRRSGVDPGVQTCTDQAMVHKLAGTTNN